MTTLAVGLLILAFLPFFVGATRTDQSKQTFLFGFNEIGDSQFKAYLDHKVDGDFDGLRMPTFPVARIEIQHDETWYTFPGRHGRQRNNFVKLYSTRSFVIRIRDGKDTDFWKTVWDFPPLDQREPKTIEPGSMFDQVPKEQSTEMQETLRHIFTGIPEPSNPIAEPRQSALIEAMQVLLRQNEYNWIADGVDDRAWSKSGPHYRGWWQLALTILLLLSVGLGIDLFRSWRRSIPSPNES